AFDGTRFAVLSNSRISRVTVNGTVTLDPQLSPAFGGLAFDDASLRLLQADYDAVLGADGTVGPQVQISPAGTCATTETSPVAAFGASQVAWACPRPNPDGIGADILTGRSALSGAALDATPKDLRDTYSPGVTRSTNPALGFDGTRYLWLFDDDRIPGG